jgi:hypothetical protein
MLPAETITTILLDIGVFTLSSFAQPPQLANAKPPSPNPHPHPIHSVSSPNHARRPHPSLGKAPPFLLSPFGNSSLSISFPGATTSSACRKRGWTRGGDMLEGQRLFPLAAPLHPLFVLATHSYVHLLQPPIVFPPIPVRSAPLPRVRRPGRERVLSRRGVVTGRGRGIPPMRQWAPALGHASLPPTNRLACIPWGQRTCQPFFFSFLRSVERKNSSSAEKARECERTREGRTDGRRWVWRWWRASRGLPPLSRWVSLPTPLGSACCSERGYVAGHNGLILFSEFSEIWGLMAWRWRIPPLFCSGVGRDANSCCAL